MTRISAGIKFMDATEYNVGRPVINTRPFNNFGPDTSHVRLYNRLKIDDSDQNRDRRQASYGRKIVKKIMSPLSQDLLF